MNAVLNPGTLSPLERLCFVGTLGMGALSYEPENRGAISHITHDLDKIARAIQATLDENNTYVDDLLMLGGSSAGTRPKVLLNLAGVDWLIKFRSHLDPKDIRQCEIQLRYAIFNVLSHNRDDHSKNCSFLMDNQGN